MKTIKYILIIIALISFQSFGQFKVTVKNGKLTNSSKNFVFDVYIESTGADINVTGWQIVLKIDNALLNGGTPTFNYLDFSDLTTLTPYAWNYQVDHSTPNMIASSFVGNEVITTTPVLLGRFSLNNSKAYANAPMMIDFDFTGDFVCELSINSNGYIIPANYFNALAPYKMTLVNDVVVNDHEYEFDVMLENTISNFTLTSYQVVLKYNQAIANGGNLSFTLLENSSTLPASVSPNPTSIQILTDGAILNFALSSLPGTATINGQYKVGRFKISNSVPFANVPGNLDWDFVGVQYSQFNISNTNFTVQSNFINNLTNSPLPVEITTFTAKETDKKIRLNWITATEERNYGFDIERKVDNGTWEKLGFIQGAGNSNSEKQYFYIDANVNGNNVQYRLKQIDTDGKFHYTNSVEVKLLPNVFGLAQNYPNPFNPETTIKYQLPVDSKVKLVVYNMIGEVVASLIDGVVNAGYHSMNFNAAGLSSGTYIYRLETPDFVQVKKMIVLK